MCEWFILHVFGLPEHMSRTTRNLELMLPTCMWRVFVTMPLETKSAVW